MTLFAPDPALNLLPVDGEVYYYGNAIPYEQRAFYFNQLIQTIAWKNDEVMLFGKKIVTKRKVAWYGDEGLAYRYSGTLKVALPWTSELLLLKHIAEKTCNAFFNSCLLNLYHDGSEGMSWHSDDERSLGNQIIIASISLGAARRFAFKHKKGGQSIEIVLEPGSLLLMKGDTQVHWLHSLPKSTKVQKPRINLTFRTIVNNPL